MPGIFSDLASSAASGGGDSWMEGSLEGGQAALGWVVMFSSEMLA